MRPHAEEGRQSLKEMEVVTLFSAPVTPVSRRFALIAGAAALLAAMIGAGSFEARAQAPLKPDVDMTAFMKTDGLPENVMGKEDAPYTIVEYSSMTCPHCAAFHKDVLPDLKKKYIDTGRAKYIVREFPLDNVAASAFMLGRCVEPAKYFDLIDLLYANQEEWAFKDNPLPGLQKFALQVGFTEDKFNQCLKDEKLLNHIAWVRDRGSKEFGVRATPTFFVNGQRLKGTGIEAFDKVIGPDSKS
ncbi:MULTISPECIES: DsbA family protein [Rhodomicrobium]|uniref:DsbA family protein n=1 Tax=Rhodomicrobium TaxID=1068 RepID=UPI001FD9B73F|nr:MULTISPECIES: DsbA family protein [Rhodomicrobium]